MPYTVNMFHRNKIGVCVLDFLYDTRNTSLFNVNDALVRQFSNPWLLFLSLTHNHEVGAEMFYLWYSYLYDITSGTLHTLRKAR